MTSVSRCRASRRRAAPGLAQAGTVAPLRAAALCPHRLPQQALTKTLSLLVRQVFVGCRGLDSGIAASDGLGVKPGTQLTRC